MRFTKVVKLRGGLQWLKDKQVYRSRRVLIGDEIALMGKKALTRDTGTDNYDVAEAICQGHLQEFEAAIQAARTADADPFAKFERKYGDPRRYKIEEIADFCAEEGWGDPFPSEGERPPLVEFDLANNRIILNPPGKPHFEYDLVNGNVITHPSADPVNFEVLLAAWELENTNRRTRRTKRRYLGYFADHLGHDNANRVTPEDYAAFKAKLLTQANAGEIAHKSVENILAAVKAVFVTGVKEKKIASNPCEGINYQAPRSKTGKTLGYTVEQVSLILHDGRTKPPNFRYPTLLAGFSGARVGELADATTHDVYMVGDMWVLDIRADYREEGQEIKNEPSIRIFPLHPQVIAEGFIDYWRSLPPGPLFPQFSLGQDNRRGDAASREISEWIRGLGEQFKDPSPKLRYKPNHSFRNYAKTHWRNARVEEEVHDAITGHGSSKDDSRNYGEYELRLMLDAIEKLPNPLVQGRADLLKQSREAKGPVTSSEAVE